MEQHSTEENFVAALILNKEFYVGLIEASKKLFTYIYLMVLLY